MNNYLLQLLKEVKTLIIPGLGALTVTNESTGEIMFMPYLKFDDGTLAKHIASKENMEIHDASNLISKFVREVTAELDKGNSYDMYQFGKFLKVDGEIAFEAWTGNAPYATVETVQETPKPEVVPPVVEEKPKEEPVSVKVEELVVPKVETPVTQNEKPTEPTPAVPPKPDPVAETPVIKEEKTVPPLVKESAPKTPEEKPQAKKEAPAPKKEAPKKENPVKDPKQKKKSPVLSYILWGLLVLILGAGTFVAIQFDSLKKDFPILAELAGENDNTAKGSDDVKVLEDEADVAIDSGTESEPVPEDQVKVVEDQLQEEKVVEKPKKEAPAPKPVKESTPKPVVKPIVTVNKKPVTKAPASSSGSSSSAGFDSSKSFHVIAGSFGSAANANKLAAKLRSQGFGDASVTLHNGMHRVSVKGFGTLNEATAEAAKIQSSVPGAWVLKL